MQPLSLPHAAPIPCSPHPCHVLPSAPRVTSHLPSPPAMPQPGTEPQSRFRPALSCQQAERPPGSPRDPPLSRHLGRARGDAAAGRAGLPAGGKGVPRRATRVCQHPATPPSPRCHPQRAGSCPAAPLPIATGLQQLLTPSRPSRTGAHPGLHHGSPRTGTRVRHHWPALAQDTRRGLSVGGGAE